MSRLRDLSIFLAGAVGVAVFVPEILLAMRGEEPVKSFPHPPQVQGKATVLPQTDPFAELKNIFPPAAQVLQVLLSCRMERCLHNSQKAPMLTTMSIGTISAVKSHLAANIEGADPEMKKALLKLHNALDQVQVPLNELDEMVKARSSALLPR